MEHLLICPHAVTNTSVLNNATRLTKISNNIDSLKAHLALVEQHSRQQQIKHNTTNKNNTKDKENHNTTNKHNNDNSETNADHKIQTHHTI